MMLGFGLIFQMPTIVFFLARMGVVTAGFLLRHAKYAILIIFIVAAVISPGTDVVSQCLMAFPMLGPLRHQHPGGVGLRQTAQSRRLIPPVLHLMRIGQGLHAVALEADACVAPDPAEAACL